MAPEFDFELDPVSFITVGTVGPPGQRTFYLQAAQGKRVVSLIIEKEQAAALATSVARLLEALASRYPEQLEDLKPLEVNMELLQPVRPAFRAMQLGLGVDEERRRMFIVAFAEPEESGQRARFVATYQQMLTLSRQAMEVVMQGRPICELCGEPIDPDGHFCPRRNGHPRVSF